MSAGEAGGLRVFSMTGYARLAGVAGEGEAGAVSWSMAIKSVNHRHLDLHLRLPSGMDGLEMELRRRLKQHVVRGHLEATLSVERVAAANGAAAFDRELVAGYVEAFREAQREHGLTQEPDLNAIFRMPGAFGAGTAGPAHREERSAVLEALGREVLERLDELMAELNQMRAAEGAALAQVLTVSLDGLAREVAAAAELRAGVQDAFYRRLHERMRAMLGTAVEESRLLQEAALLTDRSDVEEETARLVVHIQHFRDLLHGGGEVGKKLDFLLQEMNREANTLLSKSAGIPEEGVRITELGLSMKSGIEKMREQVQNLE